MQKEGYSSLAEFRKAWEEVHGAGSWDPDKVVIAYEFTLTKKVLTKA